MNTERTTLGDLTEQQRRIAEMDEYLKANVFTARLEGYSWEQIGESLGISKQTAFNRYAAYCDHRMTTPLFSNPE